MAARGKGKKPEINSEELKEQIAKVARKHFALHGVAGASLKAIAEEAKVAGSLINYHYKDKNGLFQACMEPFARTRMESIKRILGEARSRDEVRVRIELFVEEMIASIAADPHGFDIIDREIRSGNPTVLKLFQDTMLVAFNSVVDFFKTAKANGHLGEQCDPIIVASLLFSSTCDGVRKEHIAKKFFNLSFENPEFRRNYARHVVGLFMSGVIK